MLEARNTPTNFTFQEDKSVCQQITPIYLPQETPIYPLPTSVPQPAEALTCAPSVRVHPWFNKKGDHESPPKNYPNK